MPQLVAPVTYKVAAIPLLNTRATLRNNTSQLQRNRPKSPVHPSAACYPIAAQRTFAGQAAATALQSVPDVSAHQVTADLLCPTGYIAPGALAPCCKTST